VIGVVKNPTTGQITKAQRYVEKGHKKGNMVKTFKHNKKIKQSAAPGRYSAALHCGRRARSLERFL
jgi:hypothetical protein